jgi:hypothetical protein
MRSRPDLFERLITFWNREEGDDSDPLCRELTHELAQDIPRSVLAMVQSEPLRHREAIEDMVRSQLGLTVESYGKEDWRRASVATPPISQTENRSRSPAVLGEPESDRKPHSSGASMSQSGNGVQVATGNVTGNLNFATEAPPVDRGRSEPQRTESFLDADEPIRILFLGSNPDDSVRLRLDQEVREIDRALASATLGHRFQLNQKWAVRSSELQSHLLRCKPHILHFSGHGAKERGIILEGEQGTSRVLDGARLARLLGQFNQNLHCVVLNACYSEEQAQAIAQEIDCVVGMATAVEDEAAIRFASVFYEALASGYDVRAAFDLGCADVVVGEMRQETAPRLVVRRRAAEAIRFAPPARH